MCISVPLTYQVHANPVPGVHFLLDVPADGDVLGLADGIVGGAGSECGAAVGGNQVCVTGGARRGHQVFWNAVLEVEVLELFGVVAVSDWVLAAPAVLRDARWGGHGC